MLCARCRWTRCRCASSTPRRCCCARRRSQAAAPRCRTRLPTGARAGGGCAYLPRTRRQPHRPRSRWRMTGSGGSRAGRRLSSALPAAWWCTPSCGCSASTAARMRCWRGRTRWRAGTSSAWCPGTLTRRCRPPAGSSALPLTFWRARMRGGAKAGCWGGCWDARARRLSCSRRRSCAACETWTPSPWRVAPRRRRLSTLAGRKRAPEADDYI
mmetsp:Transcript_18492/g.46827  ORF Transcript_18492/g.46827 Transcript_18492/m.46827 type:complete len:213 (-) Transcript_18492:87-725(-)